LLRTPAYPPILLSQIPLPSLTQQYVILLECRISHGEPILTGLFDTDKQHILDEIKRTAKENNGIPLGTQRFFKETGIKTTDWY
jgi:hypothetical protein